MKAKLRGKELTFFSQTLILSTHSVFYIIDKPPRIIFFVNKELRFRSSRSTADAFTVIMYRISETLDNRPIAKTISILNAFDKVLRRRGLLHKLSKYGISGKVFLIINSFLSGRLFSMTNPLMRSMPTFSKSSVVPSICLILTKYFKAFSGY